MFSYWMWTRICSVTGCELEYVQLLDVNVVGLLENEKGRSWRIEEREGRGRCLVANRQLEVPLSQFLYFCLYVKLTEGPGDAIKKNWKIHLKKKIECPKKISAQSVQPFGRLYATYISIRMSCFLYKFLS